MTDPVSTERPDPIGAVVKSVGTAVSALLGVVAFLVQYGVLSADQGTAINQFGQTVVTQASPIGAIVSALIVAFTGVVASFSVGKVAKKKVTPVEDPRDNLGRVLTPAGQ